MKKHNFSAGPCILAESVLKQASEAVLNFNNDNLSLIEISHRSKPFVDVMEKAINLVKELLEVPEGYSVLFLQGGASLEFLMVPLNLMKVDGKAAYTNTGAWAKKAISEAKQLGEVVVVGDSSDKNYNYIPKGYKIPTDIDTNFQFSVTVISFITFCIFALIFKKIFSNINFIDVLLTSSVILLLPFFRTSAFWGKNENYGWLFFILALYFFSR